MASSNASSSLVQSSTETLKLVVERRDGRGNCLVAKSRIQKGERIRCRKEEFWEPLVPPVLHESCRSTHCAYCFGKLGETFYRYDDIQPPRPQYLLLFCSTKCREVGRSKSMLALEEMAIGRIYKSKGPPKMFSTAVLVYRLLIFTQLHGAKSKALKQQFEKLQHEILQSPASSASDTDYHTQAVIQTASVMVQLSKESGIILPSLEEMTAVVNRIKLNGFSICDGESVAIGVGLFDTPSFMNHSCKPNAVQTFLYGCGQSPYLYLTAYEQIQPNQEVSISYIDNTCPRTLRQQRLENDYFFHCTCKACEDIDYDSKVIGLLCSNCNSREPAIQIQVEAPSPVSHSCKSCGNIDFTKQREILYDFQSQPPPTSIEKLKQSYLNLKRLCSAESWYVQESGDRLVQSLLGLLGEQSESPQNQQQTGFETLSVLNDLLDCTLETTASNLFRQTIRRFKAAKLRLFLLPDPSKSIADLNMVRNDLSVYYPENHELMVDLRSCVQNTM